MVGSWKQDGLQLLPAAGAVQIPAKTATTFPLVSCV